MAPVRNNGSNGHGSRDRDAAGSDRKARKPLVEKRRRARINESLQDLRLLIAEADVKMENADVLEMTVRRIESILQNSAQEVEAVNREARERFAAGYIQCMHDVHTFVSSCPGIEPAVATELLNHLLESMPLNNKDRLLFMVNDCMTDLPDSSLNESLYSCLESPAPSTTSSDDLCSDLEETEAEQSQGSSSEGSDVLCLSSYSSKSMWRPW